VVVDHYSHFYSQEAASYDRAVTDWEHQRYFERI
jgi:glutamine synthetase